MIIVCGYVGAAAVRIMRQPCAMIVAMGHGRCCGKRGRVVLKIYRVLGKKGRITIPFVIRQRIGFRYNDVLSFTQQDDGSVVVRREKICDNCNEFAEEF